MGWLPSGALCFVEAADSQTPVAANPWCQVPVGSWTIISSGESEKALLHLYTGQQMDGSISLQDYRQEGAHWVRLDYGSMRHGGDLVTRDMWSLRGRTPTTVVTASGVLQTAAEKAWVRTVLPQETITVDGRTLACDVHAWKREGDDTTVTIHHAEGIDVPTMVAQFGRHDVSVYIPTDAVQVAYRDGKGHDDIYRIGQWLTPIMVNGKELSCIRWDRQGNTVHGKRETKFFLNREVPGFEVMSQYASDGDATWTTSSRLLEYGYGPKEGEGTGAVSSGAYAGVPVGTRIQVRVREVEMETGDLATVAERLEQAELVAKSEREITLVGVDRFGHPILRTRSTQGGEATVYTYIETPERPFLEQNTQLISSEKRKQERSEKEFIQESYTMGPDARSQRIMVLIRDPGQHLDFRMSHSWFAAGVLPADAAFLGIEVSGQTLTRTVDSERMPLPFGEQELACWRDVEVLKSPSLVRIIVRYGHDSIPGIVVKAVQDSIREESSTRTETLVVSFE